MQIRYAKSYCNCVPWYLPNEGMGRYTICDKIGNHCFKKKRNEMKIAKETCPPLCEQFRFITSEIHKKIDPIKECEKDDGAESIIANYLHMNLNSAAGYDRQLPRNIPMSDYIAKPLMLQFYEKMQEYKNVSLEVKGRNDILDSVKETCKAILSQDIARVSIMFESNYYVLTNTNVRVTFFDQISALGKIYIISFIPLNNNQCQVFFSKGGALGLFTGVSILSMVEICFWIFKGLIILKDMFPLVMPQKNGQDSFC